MTYFNGPQSPYLPPLPPWDPGTAAPPKGQQRWGLVAGLIVLVAVIVGAGSTAVTYAVVHKDNSSSASSVFNTDGLPAPTPKTDGTVSAAAAAISPSVVTVNVSAGQQGGTGSGIVIKADGYILTNNHVVTLDSTTQANADTITVTLPNGNTTAAKVVGTDPSDDLAVVKVATAPLTPATFASSSALTVGQTVVAMGAPLGLSNTVTSGIVSALARPVITGSGGSASIVDAIQTDAAINPGNSGGPLVDLRGRVVGVNSAIAGTGTSSGSGAQSGNIGIGFAIPSNEASRIAAELIASGKATHAILGVSVGGTQNNAGPTSATGAKVESVEAGSPAQRAGIAAGDVITKIGAQRIDDSTGAVAATRSHAPGATVTVTLTSNGKTKTVQVTLGSSTAP
ncbi:MAG: trypsin-like peptidase domain-containing protein [Jatrophihabitans sp.]